MSGMLEDIQNKKSTLSRGAQITIQSDVTKNTIITEKSEEESVNTRSLPQNIRVDNGGRNTVNALGVLGYGDSQRETLHILLDSFISNLSADEQKKISELNEIYDQKDLKSYNTKRNKSAK